MNRRFYKIETPGKRNKLWNAKHEEKLTEVKAELSRALERVCVRSGLPQTHLAMFMGTHQSRLNMALGTNLEKVTVNQLVRYLIMTEPRFRILIAI